MRPLSITITTALAAALATPAIAADTLPSAMLGTWCTQPVDDWNGAHPDLNNPSGLKPGYTLPYHFPGPTPPSLAGHGNEALRSGHARRHHHNEP